MRNEKTNRKKKQYEKPEVRSLGKVKDVTLSSTFSIPYANDFQI